MCHRNMAFNKEGKSISNVVLLQSLMYYYYNFILQFETGYHKCFFYKEQISKFFHVYVYTVLVKTS